MCGVNLQILVSTRFRDIASASLREGLEETLTVQALGITGALQRTLSTTNPIKSLSLKG